MLAVGDTVERYVVQAQLGQGGMAVVYRVEHETLKTQHALKILTVQSKGLKERLVREGQVQAHIDHPNAVTVRDVLEVGGAPALLMDFVDGPNLEDWLDSNTPDLSTALTLFRGIVEGVRAAHDQGLIHRDLKPANVLLQSTPTGLRPMVADFGLAKAIVEGEPSQGNTRSGATMGTPSYMSPEQIRDASTVDFGTDIWALGCTLYFLLTGKEAFEGQDIVDTFNRVSQGEFEDPRTRFKALPPSVLQIINGCLTPDRSARLPSCQALLDLLDAAEQEAPNPLEPLQEPRRTWLRPSVLLPLSLALGLLGTVALLLCLGSLGSWMHGFSPGADPDDCTRFATGPIGWVKGPRVLLKGKGGQFRVRGDQTVFGTLPTADTPPHQPQCVLPGGSVVQIQGEPEKLGTLGIWVPVHAGHFTLPELQTDVP